MKYFNSLNPILNMIAAVIIAVSYVYTTFATKKDVEKYVDQRHNNAISILQDIQSKVRSIDQRVWELSKERGK